MPGAATLLERVVIGPTDGIDVLFELQSDLLLSLLVFAFARVARSGRVHIFEILMII